ncbi:MAG: putative Ig domain-containing protein [bacterium]
MPKQKPPIHWFRSQPLNSWFGVIIIIFTVVFGCWYLSDQNEIKPQGEVKGVSYPPVDTYQDHCIYRGDVPDGELCGEYQTKNLVSEDSSFEFGVNGTYDSISVTQRLHYDYYNPGSGDIFSADPARGLVMTEITDEDSVDGDYSLKFDNRNAGGASIDLNYITAPETGRYVFSVWVKALEVGGKVDDNDSCSNSAIGLRLRIYNHIWANYTSGNDQFSVAPADGWKRISVVSTVDPMIQSGEIYHPEILVSSTVQPQCWGMGVLLMDAIQFEYAENQSTPAPTDYAYQTSQQELFAHTSTDAAGTNPKNGNFYWLDDEENIYAQLEILEQAALSSNSIIKWQLYDSSGDYFNTDTALDQGEILISHSASNRQTITQDLTSIIGSAVPAKSKGWFTLAYELWNPDESKMLDKEFLVMAIAEKSPYRNQDLPDSFFANHVTLGWLDINSAYDHHFFSANRPLNEYLEIARDLGIKWSREFSLISKDNIEDQVDEDPFLDDYVTAADQHHINLMPVISGSEGPEGTWQSYVATVADHYGDNINVYEVLNEPYTLDYDEYYEYLWRAEEAVRENQGLVENQVSGPSWGDDWLDNVLGYSDGIHGTGYELFDIFAPHYYNRFQYGFRQIPEDGVGIGQADIDESINTWMEQLDSQAPGGSNTKPSWNSEFGINQTRIYPDTAAVNGVPGWDGDSGWQRWDNMSGSIQTARKITSDLIRVHLYIMANGIAKGFNFGLFNTYATVGTGYSYFDYDNTPNITAPAYAEMTSLLESSNFIRRIETPELRTNGVLDDYSRAFVFEAPDLNNPGETRPVATVFNFDQEFTGAALEDIPIDTGNVDILDMEGNPISVAPGSSFSVDIDMAPIYIIGKNDLSVEDLTSGLDQTRPLAPLPSSITALNGLVKIMWTETPDNDVASYNIYRRAYGSGDDDLVDNVARQAESGTLTYYDNPGSGTWQYRIAAVEDGTGYEASSAWLPADGVYLNLPPDFPAIPDKEVAEGSLLEFTVSATDPEDDSLNFSLSNGPIGSSLTDHENGTATFRWTPDYDQEGSYSLISIVVTDSYNTIGRIFKIIVTNTNRSPVLQGNNNQSIHEGDVLNLTVSGLDEDGDNTLAFVADNLPIGASFIDHGDRTATLSWSPTTSQAGIYDDIAITVTDNHAASDSDNITITVLDGLADCAPVWQCTGWSTCTNSLQARSCTDQNACGTDADKPEEARACDSTSPNAISDLETE